jgi:hypothetical protein
MFAARLAANEYGVFRYNDLAHRAEKWLRFSLARPAGSALNDALVKEWSTGLDPKSGFHF